MKYGIAIRNMGPQSTRETLVACAPRPPSSSASTHSSFPDHLALPPDDVEGSGRARYLDVLATLAFLAGTTERIRPGRVGARAAISSGSAHGQAGRNDPGIVRRPDDSRHGRRLGCGASFEALGVDPGQRGAADHGDAPRVCINCSQTTFTVLRRAALVRFAPIVFCAAAAICRRSGSAAKRRQTRYRARVLEYGDGWHPMLPADKLGPAVAALREQARARGPRRAGNRGAPRAQGRRCPPRRAAARP